LHQSLHQSLNKDKAAICKAAICKAAVRIDAIIYRSGAVTDLI